MIPFERDDGKALRLAAIYRASRASLSQRRWESHQPQEEPHSRYLPHLHAAQQNPASPSRGEIPPLRRFLGWGERSLSLRGDSRTAGRGLSSPGFAGKGAACAGLAEEGGRAGVWGGRGVPGASVPRQMLRAGVLLLARTCLYQAVPQEPEAELSRRSRGAEAAAVPGPGNLSGPAGEASFCPEARRQAEGRGRDGGGPPPHAPPAGILERSGFGLLALGTEAGAGVPEAEPGTRARVGAAA